MSISVTVTNYIKFSGDQESELVFATPELEDSPAQQQIVTLAAGDNTITLPDVEGFTVHGLAIVPPEANDVEIVLMGAVSDTGIDLSETNVSVFQFSSTLPASIVLNASDELVGLRLVWF